MNKDEFEQKFQASAAASAKWAQAHGKVSLGIACFIIGWILGKFV